jgi:hypothetical protein
MLSRARNSQTRAATTLIFAFLTGALWVASPGAAFAQDAPSLPVWEDNDCRVGEPSVGDVGITETVEQIMERQRLNDEMFGPPKPRTVKPPRMQPQRFDLPSDPDAPAVSQWPPASEGDRDLDFEDLESPSTRSPQAIGANFLGVQSSESGWRPPDTQGCVGPTQVVAYANGRVKVFSKTGVLGGLNASLDTFFNSVRGAASVGDTQCRFDRTSGRYFIVAIGLNTPNRIVLAVSNSSTITNASSFTFYQFQHDLVGTTPNADTGAFFDYPGIGVDANALYVGGNVFSGGFIGSTMHCIRKSSVTSGGPIVVTPFRQIAVSSGPFSPRGVDNDDAAATDGYIIGAAIESFSRLTLRRVTNPGGTPTLSGNINLTVPTTTNPQSVACLGSSNPLDGIDDRLYSGTIRKNRLTGAATLWTAHHFEVNASGVASGSGNRNGSRWYEIQNFTTTPSLRQSGTFFHNAATNPDSFWFPSVTMSGQGHMAIGTSAAGINRHGEIVVSGRFSGDTLGTNGAATTAVTSTFNYNLAVENPQRWGDMSATCVDPTDDMTMWTFQEYCNATDSWAVRCVQLLAPPPATPASCAPNNGNQGQTLSVVVTGTSSAGSGFFDPDASFPNHIAAGFSGANITVNSITFTDATHVTLNITIGAAAATGARDVTITNPDGQIATGVGLFSVNGGCTSPSVTGQPSNQSACSGASAAFSVTAAGSAPLSFQWRRGTTNLVSGGNISGAATATLTINPVGAGDAASDYNCVVTNACGNTTSNNATLTVNTAPGITGQPSNQSACSGASAAFSVTVSGSPAPTFQWRRGTTNLVNGGNISGATSATLTINPVGVGDAATNYNCVVTNVCSNATSNNATLTVNTAPSVTGQPSNQTACSGASTGFTVTASGTGPLSYQWRRGTTNLVNGGNISGATTPSLSINPVGTGDAVTNYNCVVTNACGSATSNNATLTVNTAAAITGQPSDQTVCSGSPASFTVSASGSPPPTFQWRRGITNLVNGGNISGATSATLTINPAAVGDAATNYNCVVTNGCGSATSNDAALTVNSPPSITADPAATSACVGASASFSVTASGTGPLSYQWRRGASNLVNGGSISGATTPTLTINPVAPGDAASDYNCVVTNACGSDTSNNAALTVGSGPTINTQPSDTSACTGQSAAFTVAASGSGTLTYQWRRGTTNLVDGGNISGTNTPTLTINPVAAGDAATDYNCVVGSDCGSTTSANAALAVDAAPTITTQPTNQSASVGGSATFNIVASGSGPLAYQWRRGATDLVNGGSISGADTSTLTINPVAAGDAATDYNCVVTSACGSATSSDASLTVSTSCPGDLNGDGNIDLGDLTIFLSNFGILSGATAEQGDMDGDGDIDLTDLTNFLSLFGTSC